MTALDVTPTSVDRRSSRRRARATGAGCWSAQWPFRLRRFVYDRPDSESIGLHYSDEGSGPALVLVHAGMWSFIWRDTIAALRDDFRCITLDFPGAGLSDGGRDDVDLTTFRR